MHPRQLLSRINRITDATHKLLFHCTANKAVRANQQVPQPIFNAAGAKTHEGVCRRTDDLICIPSLIGIQFGQSNFIQLGFVVTSVNEVQTLTFCDQNGELGRKPFRPSASPMYTPTQFPIKSWFGRGGRIYTRQKGVCSLVYLFQTNDSARHKEPAD